MTTKFYVIAVQNYEKNMLPIKSANSTILTTASTWSSTFSVANGNIKMNPALYRSKKIVTILSNFSTTLDYSIASLIVYFGIKIYFEKLQNVDFLINLSAIIIVLYGLKRVLDAVLKSIMGKELEQLMKTEKS